MADDFSHYTRDPERPFQRQRLMLVINEKDQRSSTSGYGSEILDLFGRKDVEHRLLES